MSTERKVEWGHWSITFWEAGRAQFQVSFPVGAQGPCDGFLGSPEREGFKRACREWVASGTVPDGAYAPIEAAWLYDPACPKAIWRDGEGWVSPVKIGRAWEFPSYEALEQARIAGVVYGA